MFMDFLEDMWPFVLILAILIGVLVVLGIRGDQNYNRLLAECMADGNKEYKCVSMLKSNDTQIIPMPVVIPVR